VRRTPVQSQRVARVEKTRPALVRVAVYVRQSVEDAKSEFGSIQAQREAVEAYVASQRSQGWHVAEVYEDAGWSGSNIERPAFKRLLADIEAGRVDSVVTYKLDRLSRSLADFVRLIEFFDRCRVSFVSTTQSFSTATIVGRLTMNLLATFGQFERETIAERTRDKVRAARRKGLWSGGCPPMGYDLIDGKLVVNEAEGATVREIFATYRDHGSILATMRVLAQRGIETKAWTTKDGRNAGGSAFGKATLHAFLTNPLFIGRVRLGGETFEGQHAAIVSTDLWDAVQATFTTEPRIPPKTLNKHGALLAGLITCAVCGSSMGHVFANRGARRWGSYVCQRVVKEGASACRGSRVSRPTIEDAVVAHLRATLQAPVLVDETMSCVRHELEGLGDDIARHDAERVRWERAIARLVDAGGDSDRLSELRAELDATQARLDEARANAARAATIAQDEDGLRRAMAAFDPVWRNLDAHERARVLGLLVENITFDGRTGAVEIRLRGDE